MKLLKTLRKSDQNVMAKKPERIVLDTNVFIYFLINDSFQKLENRLKKHEVRLLISEELLSEFLEVVKRPKFKKYFSEKQVNELISSLNYYADLIEVESLVNICRDKKDNFLLQLSIDGKADYLITGDEDLLILGKINKTVILKITDYLSI